MAYLIAGVSDPVDCDDSMDADFIEQESANQMHSFPTALYVCGLCNQVFSDLNSYDEHEQLAHNVQYNPTIPDETTQEEESLGLAYAEDADIEFGDAVVDNSYRDSSARKCRAGPYAVGDASDIVPVLGKVTKKDRRVVRLTGDACVYCPYRIRSPGELVHHMVEEHDVELTDFSFGIPLPLNPDEPCPFCALQLDLAHDFFLHVLVEHSNEVFSKQYLGGDLCRINMQTPSEVNLSLSIRCKPKRALPRGMGKLMPVVHPISAAQFREAERSIRIHRNGFQCRQCFRVKDSKETCVEHIVTNHMTPRNHVCPLCAKQFWKPSALNKHIVMAHTAQRGYPCPRCPMTYKNKANLEKHLERNVCEVAKKGGYPCDKCGIIWYHPGALSTHVRQCNGVRVND